MMMTSDQIAGVCVLAIFVLLAGGAGIIYAIRVHIDAKWRHEERLQQYERDQRRIDLDRERMENDRDAVLLELTKSHGMYCPACGKQMELRSFKRMPKKEKRGGTANIPDASHPMEI